MSFENQTQTTLVRSPVDMDVAAFRAQLRQSAMLQLVAIHRAAIVILGDARVQAVHPKAVVWFDAINSAFDAVVASEDGAFSAALDHFDQTQNAALADMEALFDSFGSEN